ncbi:MAG: ACT domain-containing protein [Limisphaerales bacterium]|jgi:hypothetical protein
MKLKQLSLFLENKPGALNRPIRLLASANCNLLALSLAEAKQFGILRLIVRDWQPAQELLEKNGFVVKVTDVVAVEAPDRPGGLADVLDALAHAKINVEFMYAFTQTRLERGVLVFCFNDPDKAIAVLQKERVNVVENVDWLAQS